MLAGDALHAAQGEHAQAQLSRRLADQLGEAREALVLGVELVPLAFARGQLVELGDLPLQTLALARQLVAAPARIVELLLQRPARLLQRLTSDVDALDNLYLRLLVPAVAALLYAACAALRHRIEAQPSGEIPE